MHMTLCIPIQKQNNSKSLNYDMMPLQHLSAASKIILNEHLFVWHRKRVYRSGLPKRFYYNPHDWYTLDHRTLKFIKRSSCLKKSPPSNFYFLFLGLMIKKKVFIVNRVNSDQTMITINNDISNRPMLYLSLLLQLPRNVIKLKIFYSSFCLGSSTVHSRTPVVLRTPVWKPLE